MAAGRQGSRGYCGRSAKAWRLLPQGACWLARTGAALLACSRSHLATSPEANAGARSPRADQAVMPARARRDGLGTESKPVEGIRIVTERRAECSIHEVDLAPVGTAPVRPHGEAEPPTCRSWSNSETLRRDAPGPVREARPGVCEFLPRSRPKPSRRPVMRIWSRAASLGARLSRACMALRARLTSTRSIWSRGPRRG